MLSGPKAAADQVINRVVRSNFCQNRRVLWSSIYSKPALNSHTCPIYTNGYDSSNGWSIGANGTIGTNRKGCNSSGSIGEYASH